MDAEAEWHKIRGDFRSGVRRAGFGMLRATLLFGGAMLALAVIATPYIERETRSRLAGTGAGSLDMMATGSIAHRDSYIVRRSVLQPSPGSVCVIRSDGSRRGDC